MRNKALMSVIMATLVAPMAIPTAAEARYYHGHDRYYRYHCKRSSGTTGLIAGGAGGALLGNALGGGTLGTIAGGVGGALLGQHLDKRHDAAQNRRNGC